jgi:hypothetical protein
MGLAFAVGFSDLIVAFLVTVCSHPGRKRFGIRSFLDVFHIASALPGLNPLCGKR